MSKNMKCKVLVIGAGPGGYVAAIRSGQLGMDTIIVEGERTGGTCLIKGCIPSKAMIHAASRYEELLSHSDNNDNGGNLGIHLSSKPKLKLKETVAWKETIVDRLSSGVEGLLKKAKVKVVHGWATFQNGKTCQIESKDGSITITAEHVILANGSVSTELPFLPFGEPVISSTEALLLNAVPKQLVVIGAGYIGMELGIAYRKMGANITFIEALDQILPLYDKELSKPVESWLKQHDVTVHLNAKAKGLKSKDKKHSLEYEDSKGKTQSIEADKILVTVGRKANTENWGLENMAVDMNGPFIKIDNQCRTSMKNVWAVGDVTGEPMLAHRASAQAEMVAEIIAGKKRQFDPISIAAVCFTEPEILGVGMSPDEAKKAGEETIIGKFPLAANGRALSMQADEGGGFVRVTARKSDHVILGIHAVGPHVSELSGEFALAIEMGSVLEDIAGTIHVHPTMTETFAEASLAALGHPIHI